MVKNLRAAKMQLSCDMASLIVNLFLIHVFGLALQNMGVNK
jgi:hypothetical protein